MGGASQEEVRPIVLDSRLLVDGTAKELLMSVFACVFIFARLRCHNLDE